MIEITIGINSNGISVNEDLLLLDNLFVSYISSQQMQKFLHSTILKANDKMCSCLLVCKHHNIVDITKNYKVDTYIYDSPTSGNIQKKNSIFNAIYNSFVKQKNTSKNSTIQLVMIDDFWQIAPMLTKHNLKQFKELITQGSQFGIYFIIGSSMPFRNLLVQLMNLGKPRNPLNEFGAEIVFSSDELIFFRERNVLNFKMFYPEHIINEEPPPVTLKKRFAEPLSLAERK